MRELWMVLAISVSVSVTTTYIMSNKGSEDAINKQIAQVGKQCMHNENFAVAYKNYTQAKNGQSTIYYANMLESCKPLQTYELQRSEKRKKNQQEFEKTYSFMLRVALALFLMLVVLFVFVKTDGLHFLRLSLEKRFNGNNDD